MKTKRSLLELIKKSGNSIYLPEKIEKVSEEEFKSEFIEIATSEDITKEGMNCVFRLSEKYPRVVSLSLNALFLEYIFRGEKGDSKSEEIKRNIRNILRGSVKYFTVEEMEEIEEFEDLIGESFQFRLLIKEIYVWFFEAHTKNEESQSWIFILMESKRPLMESVSSDKEDDILERYRELRGLGY